MSTYALTMYRYIHKLDGKEYKVGNAFSFCLKPRNIFYRHMGHRRARMFPNLTSFVLFCCQHLHFGILTLTHHTPKPKKKFFFFLLTVFRHHTKNHLPTPENLVYGDEGALSEYSLHLNREQD